MEPIPHTARDDVILAPESRIMDHRRQELEQELPAASVIAFNTSVVRAATTAILAVPTRIAPRVVGLKAAAQVESIIRGVIVEVLQGLSKLEVLPASGHTTTRADEAV